MSDYVSSNIIAIIVRYHFTAIISRILTKTVIVVIIFITSTEVRQGLNNNIGYTGSNKVGVTG